MSVRAQVLAAALLGAAAIRSLAAQAPSGGTGTIYYGTYDRKVLVIDEASMNVRDSMRVSIGIPMGMTLSADRKSMYIIEPNFESIEVFDLATRKAKGQFSLSNDSVRVRIRNFNIDPRDRFAVLLVKTAQRKSDRWVIGRPTLLKYDLARKVVTDTIRWPGGEEREFAQVLFSPDGGLMYFFTADDILVYDTATLREVDRFDLQHSIDDGVGRLSFGFPESLYDEPGFYTSLFRTTDPVNHRALMGVARVDLARRAVDFYSLGPSEPVGFALAPGRRRAFGLRQQVGNYQFWTFDLENRQVSQRVEFDGRPRMGLSVSSNGRVLYVHTAGPTIDLYDAETLQKIRTVEYRADMTRVLVVP
ncbi:MAG: hypothetical protein IT361_14120 [Gemmatimonadaceae bacterium]|nr:hypothetical protein [Gemmatimonadaceae bacterium]